MTGPDTPWEFKVLILSITIDVICLYKLMKWGPMPETNVRNGAVVIISGLILYFTVGWIWYNAWSIPTTDPWGVTSDLQLGMIAVSMCPGLLVMTIWTFISDEIVVMMREDRREERKRRREERK